MTKHFSNKGKTTRRWTKWSRSMSENQGKVGDYLAICKFGNILCTFVNLYVNSYENIEKITCSEIKI